MPKKQAERLAKMLKSNLTERTILRELSMNLREMESFLDQCAFNEVAMELLMHTDQRGRFVSEKVIETLLPILKKFSDEPSKGWAMYAYNAALDRLFPPENQTKEDLGLARGRAFLLVTLHTLYQFERKTLPFDPSVDMRLLNPKEVDEKGYNKEYKRFDKIVKNYYIYEFMRLGVELTPYNTLGHIAGVHHVAMYMARQLVDLKVPCDLGLVSASAAGHDIGKYGCKKGEEKRVPYLHYYYTDLCFNRFNLPLIGHIAANHSTWDLELENLSVESLLLIYADFRVKSSRNEDGTETVNFYSLKDAFQVILDKLDNVDDAKELRYRKVYNKLKDFEDYMVRMGISVEIEGVPAEVNPPKIAKPVFKEVALLSRNEVVKVMKWSAVDHNIKVMNKFYQEEEFANLLEAARSEKQWRNLRTYIAILGEYSAYMTEKQKLLTIRFLYEMLTHRESDIRNQASEIIGRIIAKFNTDFRKEIPSGVRLAKKRITNKSLWKTVIEHVLNPDQKLTDKHRMWIGNSLKGIVESTLLTCKPEMKKEYIDVLVEWFRNKDISYSCKISLFRVARVINPADCNFRQQKEITSFANRAKKEDSIFLKIAAERTLMCFKGDDEETYLAKVKPILGLSEDANHEKEAFSDMFLDNLKAGTPWIVKIANIEQMLSYLEKNKDEGTALHIATHLANLVKVSEAVSVRRTAGEALIRIIDTLLPEQRNEITVELEKGLEIGDYQYSKYIPDYLGRIMLHLPPRELDESIDDLEKFILGNNEQVAVAVLHTFGVLLENYQDYYETYGKDEDKHTTETRFFRVVNALNRGFGNYINVISKEAIWTIGVHIFGSTKLSVERKYDIFKVCSKKFMTLFDDRAETDLDLFNNAAAFKSIYNFICDYEIEVGKFNILEKRQIAFFPGTFDPFSSSHKAIAKEICDRGFEVYLALDEFSWSKKTQPRLQRRKIMKMSVANEPDIFLFPDNISINIANPKDLGTLKSLFVGKELYFVAGSDVIKNASCYRAEPVEDSIHSLNHIIFKRESNEIGQGIVPPSQKSYPIAGKIINLYLEKFYEDISSTRIRENIDLNRDISSLIDPVAQNYIMDKSMYLREPAYKHVLMARDIQIEPYMHRSASILDDMRDELEARGFDTVEIDEYLDKPETFVTAIRDGARDNKVVAVAAANRLDSIDLLKEFGNQEIAASIRAQAAGAIAILGGFYCSEKTVIDNLEQILLTEILTELLKRDYTYVVFHPVEEGSLSKSVGETLTKQGFIDISEEDGRTILAVNMKMPVIIFKNIATMIKSPLNKNSRVLKRIEEAHDKLLEQVTNLFPGELVLSLNAGIMHHKMISLITKLNNVPVNQRTEKIYGKFMAVPFGKVLSENAVPNTVTKTLHTEKYFNREVSDFTVEQSCFYSPLKDQVNTIKSFNRPVILIDDLLHKGYRMNEIDPILKEAEVSVEDTVVGVQTGRGRDLMTIKGRNVDSAYFLPNLRFWLDESALYPFIGGDSMKDEEIPVGDSESIPALNLILPYAVPTFIGNLSGSRLYDYSMTCLENSKEILHTLEEEYQKVFEKKLTLKRLGEVIVSPKQIEVSSHATLDETAAPSVFVEEDIEKLIRLKEMFRR